MTERTIARDIGRFLATMAIGAVGAAVFFGLNLPLPFMLGPMTFTIVAAVAGAPLLFPARWRPVFTAIIGAMLGSTFSAELLSDLPRWSLTLAGLTLYSLTAAVVSVGFFHRIGGYDLKTAYFSGMPGGLIEMVSMAEDTGADPRRVSLCHGLRILLIVSAVPWIVRFMTGADLTALPPGRPSVLTTGWEVYFWLAVSCVVGMAIARRVYIPAGHIIAPMLVSAAIHVGGVSDFKIPGELVVLAQVVIGTTLGVRFVGARARELLEVIPAILGSVLILLTVTGVFAWALGALTGLPAVTMLLSYSPGGFTEMAVVAMSLGIDPAFVAAHHLARVAMVSAGGVFLFRFIVRNGREN